MRDKPKLNMIHKGETCVVIGNGPSLNKVPNKWLDKYITLGSNQIYRKPYRPDYYCIIDEAMMKVCLPTIKAGWRPKKQMFLRAEVCIEDNYPIYPVTISAFSTNIDNCVCMGGTVTYALLQIASYLGFKKIYLVGIDHHYPKSFRNKHEAFKAVGADPDHFICEDGEPYFTPGETFYRPEDTTLAYEHSKIFLDELGVEIINLTEGTKLDTFEKGSIEDYG
jgi:hypothetical protein